MPEIGYKDVMGCLYKLTFPSGKIYIGITSGRFKRRVVLHLSQAKEGRVGALSNAIRKYGDVFERTVLVFSDNWNYLCDLEVRAIAAFGSLAPAGYNLTIGGEGTPGRIVTAEQRAQMSAARAGKNLGNKASTGYRHTEDAKRRMSAARTGVVFSEERKAKIGATKIGNTYGTGRIVSDETRKKISDAQKGKPRFSTEQKLALSAKRKGRPWTEARRAAQRK